MSFHHAIKLQAFGFGRSKQTSSRCGTLFRTFSMNSKHTHNQKMGTHIKMGTQTAQGCAAFTATSDHHRILID